MISAAKFSAKEHTLHEEELTQAVLQYLNDTTDNYAIMITGPWGCGKTYYIEHPLRKTLKEQEWNMIRVSMFGIASTDDFYDRLLSAIFSPHPGENPSTNEEAPPPRSLKRIIKNVIERVKCFTKSVKEKAKCASGTAKDLSFSIVQTFLKKYGIQFSVATKSISELFLGPKTILVLDDLERCLLSETQLLGLIDPMVETQGKKLILLANEDELLSKACNSTTNPSGESSYLAVKEKLVWRTYSFELDIDIALRTLFYESVSQLVGNSKDATNTILTQYRCILQSYEEKNIRIIKRSMSICEVLKESKIFAGAQSDAYLQAALIGLLDLSTYVSRTSFTPKEDLEQEEWGEKSYIDTYMEASRKERLDTVPFVREYLISGRTQEPQTTAAELTNFISAYYPNDELAQKAISAISKWQYRTFQNSDVPSMISSIMQALISPADGGLSFDRYCEAIEVLDNLRVQMPNQHIDMSVIIEAMEEAIDSDPNAALESVRRGFFSKSTEYSSKDADKIVIADNLREYICQKSLSLSIGASRSILDNPDELQPSKIIEIINSEHDLTRCAHVLTAIDIHVAAKRLPECSNEEVHVVYEAIHSPKLKAMLQTDMGERVRKWLSEFGDALNPSATDEIANRDVLEYIKQGAGKIAETTQ